MQGRNFVHWLRVVDCNKIPGDWHSLHKSLEQALASRVGLPYLDSFWRSLHTCWGSPTAELTRGAVRSDLSVLLEALSPPPDLSRTSSCQCCAPDLVSWGSLNECTDRMPTWNHHGKVWHLKRGLGKWFKGRLNGNQNSGGLSVALAQSLTHTNPSMRDHHGWAGMVTFDV